MSRWNRIHRQIYESIRVISEKEKMIEEMRKELNHEIMFNLKDVYVNITNRQASISMNCLVQFLGMKEPTSVLEKLVKWNNHCSSLNLTFAEFSALLITKEDKLLAKMVIEREEMGAIPNFLLEKIRRILLQQMELHSYCLSKHIGQDQQLKQWVQTVTDENGDVDESLLQKFLQIHSPQDQDSQSSNIHHQQHIYFMRFLQASGNITGQNLLFLWIGGCQQQNYLHDLSTKMAKLSTCISSPKSLLGSQSQHNLLRAEFYDCISRPICTEGNDVRETRSIEKHVNRVNSNKLLKTISKLQRKKVKETKEIVYLLEMIKEIVAVQKETQNHRIQLRLCPDFYPILFFDSIPKDRSKMVSTTILKDFLESFGYFVPNNEIYYLFRRYSSTNKLDFNSFCQIFDVVNSQFNLLEKNRYVQSLQDICYQTKRLFFSLIINIIKNECKINKIKAIFYVKLKNMSKIVNILFDNFSSKKGGIGIQELRDLYLSHLSINISALDLKLFMKRCNTTLIQQQISINKFHRQLLPHNPVSAFK